MSFTIVRNKGHLDYTVGDEEHPYHCLPDVYLDERTAQSLVDVLNAAEAVVNNLQAGPDVLGNLCRAVAAFKKESGA